MEAILSLVTLGELSLPQVGAVWLELVSPGVHLTLQAPTGSKLPLFLSGQPFPPPSTVGTGIIPAHVYHWELQSLSDARAGTCRLPPECPFHWQPPEKRLHLMGCFASKLIGHKVLKNKTPPKRLSLCPVLLLPDKVPEIFVGDRKYVNGKGFYCHLPDRSFTISAIW